MSEIREEKAPETPVFAENLQKTAFNGEKHAQLADTDSRENAELRMRIAELESELDTLRRASDAQGRAMNALARDLGECMAERDGLQDAYDKLREKCARQARQLTGLQDALEKRNGGELKSRWERQVKALEVERDAYKAERDILQAVYARFTDTAVELCKTMGFSMVDASGEVVE